MKKEMNMNGNLNISIKFNLEQNIRELVLQHDIILTENW